jgi:hypothetical protein
MLECVIDVPVECSSYFLKVYNFIFHISACSLSYKQKISRRKFLISLAGNFYFWILLPGREILYPGLINTTSDI